MIVGKGLVATSFEEFDRDDVVFFASGVSNSLETNPEAFMREETLVRNTIMENKDKLFVYFSTCSIYDSSKFNSPYVLHKLHIEEIIKSESKSYLILRVSNAVGRGGNPNQLMNYLSQRIKDNEQITVYKKAQRNIIDVSDVASIAVNLVKSNVRNCIINLAFPQNFSPIEIIHLLQEHHRLVAKMNIIDEGETYTIDTREIEEYFAGISKGDYLNKIIKKYF